MPRKRHYVPSSSKRLQTPRQRDDYYFTKIAPQLKRVMNLTPKTFHTAAAEPAPADHVPMRD